MKKTISVLMLLFCLTLTACGSSDSHKEAQKGAVDGYIDYISIKGEKYYLCNDLGVFVRQFKDLPYTLRYNYNNYLISEISDEVSEEISSDGSFDLHVEVRYDTELAEDDSSYYYPLFSIAKESGLQDENGAYMPYYWRISCPVSGDFVDISIKGKVFDYKYDDKIKIEDIIALLGDEYEYEELAISILDKKADYIWEDGKYKYIFEVNVEDEKDDDYHRVTAIRLNAIY